jgi:hypothetical protein
MKMFHLCCLCILLASAAHPQVPLEITLHSTSIVKKTAGGDAQVVAADIVAVDSVRAVTVEMWIPGRAEPHRRQLGPIPGGTSRRFFEIPVVQKSDSATIHILVGGAIIRSGKFLVSPPRVWKIYDVQVSHPTLAMRTTTISCGGM